MGRRWQPEEIQALEAFYANPYGTLRDLAQRLGRTVASVSSRACYSGLTDMHSEARYRNSGQRRGPRMPASLPRHPLIRSLVTARVDAQLTLYDLAKRVGCDAARLSKYEREEHQPSLRVLVDWANALNHSVMLSKKTCPVLETSKNLSRMVL